ncbi:MAG: hypothetical protein QM642_04745 [Edaphocola sp.]
MNVKYIIWFCCSAIFWQNSHAQRGLNTYATGTRVRQPNQRATDFKLNAEVAAYSNFNQADVVTTSNVPLIKSNNTGGLSVAIGCRMANKKTHGLFTPSVGVRFDKQMVAGNQSSLSGFKSEATVGYLYLKPLIGFNFPIGGGGTSVDILAGASCGVMVKRARKDYTMVYAPYQDAVSNSTQQRAVYGYELRWGSQNADAAFIVPNPLLYTGQLAIVNDSWVPGNRKIRLAFEYNQAFFASEWRANSGTVTLFDAGRHVTQTDRYIDKFRSAGILLAVEF